MKASVENTAFEVKIPNSGYAEMSREELSLLELGITKEIIECEEVKSCLKYFLASYESMLFPETANQSKEQMNLIFENLVVMYTELKKIRLMLNPLQVVHRKPQTVVHSADEVNAIMLMNKDRRFTTTE